MTRRAARLAAVTLTIALALTPVAARAWVVDTATHDEATIKAEWADDQPSYTGTPYLTAPRTTAPFAAGELRSEFLDDGLRAVNFVRFLAGLPDDVTLSADYNSRTQHGSVINAANGVLDHFPVQPVGMSDSFYTLGKSGASQSNLAWGTTELERAVKLYMADSDSSNISHLGHRRWILNPPMTKTGFGQAGSFSSMYVFDRSRTEAVDYDTISWPADGYFPVEFFSAGSAWSVTIDPSRYAVNASALRVTLRRASDGRTWTFTPADTPSGTPGDGEYFAYSSAGYAVPSCVIFRPPLDVTYAPGESFEMTVAAGVTSRASSQPVVFSQRTTFMSLAAVPPAAAAMELTSPSTVTYGSQYVLRAVLTKQPSQPVVGKGVLFESSRDGGRTWSSLGAAATDASGTASLGWTATATSPAMRIRARWGGDGATMAAQATQPVAVRPYITVAPPSSATRGRAFAVTGYLKPRHGVGTYPASVKCYKRINGAWVYKASFRARVVSNSTTSSRVRASVTLPAGTWQLKLYHPGDTYHTSAYSSGRNVSVR